MARARRRASGGGEGEKQRRNTAQTKAQRKEGKAQRRRDNIQKKHAREAGTKRAGVNESVVDGTAQINAS